MFAVYVIRGFVEILVDLFAVAIAIGAVIGFLRVLWRARRGFAGPPESRRPHVYSALAGGIVRRR